MPADTMLQVPILKNRIENPVVSDADFIVRYRKATLLILYEKKVILPVSLSGFCSYNLSLKPGTIFRNYSNK